MLAWVIWSELHASWRVKLPTGVVDGFTRSLMRAGLFTETRAQEIAATANRGCIAGEWLEWALPDPLAREV